MIFSSYGFIFAFLPLCLAGYYAFGMINRRAGQVWLLAASVFFYGYWDWRFFPLLLGSMTFNYVIGSRLLLKSMKSSGTGGTKVLLWVGIGGNLALLGWFKYAGFFVDTVKGFGIWNGPDLKIILPIGISFFTFTQVAFLVDAAKGCVRNSSFSNYGLFVTFFPHLLAGPILHHAEMMPQFDRDEALRPDARNIAAGLLLFAIGIFKKVLIADQFAPLANAGYENWALLAPTGTWLATTAYSLQLYFDFSGYTDMALGLALFFNIELPMNFNSPYKATDVQDFWRRWHMTLSRFLRDYLYFPLGGSCRSELLTWRNLLVVFVLGGLWHGAGWTFVIWGVMYGVGMCVHRAWHRTGLRLPRPLAWVTTILFVHVAWIFFRSRTLEQAWAIVGKLAGIGGKPQTDLGVTGLLTKVADTGQSIFFRDSISATWVLGATLIFGGIAVLAPNSGELRSRFKPGWATACAVGGGIGFAVLQLGRVREFLYFNF